MAPSRRQIAGAAIVAAFLAVPVIAAMTGSNALLNMASRVAIYAIVALSLDLLVGWSALVSFGHAAFFGLGGYAVAIAAFHLADGSTIFGWSGSNEALVTLPLAMVVAGGAALAIGALSLRTSGVYFIMITLAFAQMIYFLFVALKYYGGDDGLSLAGRNRLAGYRMTDAASFYWLCLAVLAACVVIQWRILGSRFGIVLRAAAASERRALAVGLPVYRYRLAAFVIAGAMAGLAGGLSVNLTRFASPDMMSWLHSGEFLVMIIMGGLASLGGPIVGAAAFLLVESTLSAATQYWQVVFGPFVLAVALFMPKGIWGFVRGGKA
jgi:branched-chain amino acid transport system permease protein